MDCRIDEFDQQGGHVRTNRQILDPVHWELKMEPIMTNHDGRRWILTVHSYD